MAEHEGAVRIQPPGRSPDLALGELYRYRGVAIKLALRSISAHYRQTLIGIAWVLIQPLALMVVFSVFIGLLSRSSPAGIPYPVFFITGLAIWIPALQVFNEGTTSLLNNQQLVTRVYLPRPLIPLSVALASLVDLFFTLIATQAILLLYGYLPSLAYLALPFLIAVAYMTMLGAAYFTSATNVAYRDVGVALPFVSQFWFFASPLLYSVEIVPERWWPLYYLNPMALVLGGFHWALAGAPAVPWWAWLESSMVAALLLVGGYVYFRWREPTFADLL